MIFRPFQRKSHLRRDRDRGGCGYGEEREFTLLGPDEADYAKGTISIQSPVGVALLGKEVGDEITVNAPRGRINYEIIDIQFKKKTA